MAESKEDLLEQIRLKAKELGRTPKQSEMKNLHLYKKVFDSWNQAIIEAGLTPNRLHLTNEEMIQLLQQKADELGRTPKMEDMTESRAIANRFGSWNQALEQAGLAVNRDWVTDEELIQELQETARKLGRTPKKREFPRWYLIDQHFGSWNEGLERAGLSIRQKQAYTPEEIIERLHDWVAKHGEVPSIRKWNKTSIPDNRTIERIMGKTWNEFLTDAGYEIQHPDAINVTHTREELLQMYIELSERLGRPATIPEIERDLPYSFQVFEARFGSMYELRQEAGLPSGNDRRKVTKKELIRILSHLYQQYGRRLSHSELKREGVVINTLLNRFHTTKLSEVWDEIEQIERIKRSNHSLSIQEQRNQ